MAEARIGFLQFKQQRLLLFALLVLVAISSNQLNYQTDHEQIVIGAGDILSYFAMSEAAPGLVTVPVPYHHAQRIFLPYLLGIVSDVTGLSIPMTYLVAGSLLLALAFWFFVRCCELLGMREETVFIVSMAVLFNPYLFRHYFMFNGYINDIGFLAGLSASLFGLFAGRRGIMLAGIVLASLSRQTTLVILPAYILLEYALNYSRGWRINIFTLSYLTLPILIYIGTSFIASHTGLPSETDMALLGLLYWIRSDFSIGRFLDFTIRGVIPFAFAFALLLGCRVTVPRERDRLLVVAGLLALIVPICAQPFLGGPDWTLNSIARLNALAAFPVFLLVGMSIDSYMNRLSPQIASALGALIVLGSVHHIYTFPGAFSAEKNKWFAVVHFSAAFATAVVLWISTRRDQERERAGSRLDAR
ncbi:hypothetical protein [Neoroseomonas soli]|uniref:Uncharacterized protein n=1 Tax=Neoroseomonas soli TaxID=1081025 RepID=A0A9X9WX66_9PROT|nr:hypothetical protein [Neoroseomonas soli]MBR0671745.1 hypothetical protein [Neoroseomonas soli]